MFRSVAPSRSWRIVAAAVLVSSSVAVTVSPQAAGAYTPLQPGSCNTISWSSPPQVQIHATEYLQGGGDPDLQALFDAVYEVNREFNRVGGTWAQLASGGASTLSMAPFDLAVPFNDSILAPTLHIGFTDDPADIPGVSEAGTAISVGCVYSERRMVFLVPDLNEWNFGTPQESGEDFSTATRTDAAGAEWFRPVYMHELLHAFGLDHSDASYAFMNAGEYPWANRPGPESMRPLPDDIRFLREHYPLAGTRSEVAALNTWFDATRSSGGAAVQDFNCAPSLGTTDSAAFDAPFCGTGGPDGGSTDVCPGDILRTRFTVSNYSTSSVDLEARLHLSTDEAYDLQDWVSPSRRPIAIGAGRSETFSRTWLVPNPEAFNDDFSVIVRVSGTTSAGAAVEDWIPLVGGVHIGTCGGEGLSSTNAAEIPGAPHGVP